MVARKQGADSALMDVLWRGFDAWRELLDHAVGLTLNAAVGVTRRTEMRRTATPSGMLRGGGVVAVGIACLLGGAVLGVAIAAPGAPTVDELIAAVATVLWAVVRLILMRLAVPSLKSDPRGLRGAWVVGLTPWLFGVVPALRLLAWVISAAVTFMLLRRLTSPVNARKALMWAWGAQALAVAGLWLVRNLVVILMTG